MAVLAGLTLFQNFRLDTQVVWDRIIPLRLRETHLAFHILRFWQYAMILGTGFSA